MELMELFADRGAVVSYSDPHIPQFPPMRKHAFTLTSVPLSAATLGRVDAVVLATDHDAFDYDLIASESPLILDTRGRYRNPQPNVVSA